MIILLPMNEIKCLIVGQIYKSRQNGMVYDPQGVCPCLCVGNHSGVEPKIILYDDKDNTSI